MVKFFTWEILKKSSINLLRQEVNKAKTNLDLRPNLDQLYTMTSTDGAIKIPFYPLPDRVLYVLAMQSDVLKTVINALKGEIFRKGFDIEEKFFEKCINPDCGKEFMQDVKICDACGAQVRKPIIEQKLKLLEILKHVNLNHQSLLEVLKQEEDDLNIIDNGFTLFLKKYNYDYDGAIVNGDVVEIIRGDPRIMRKIADKTGRLGYNDSGYKVYTCPECRDKLVTENEMGDGRCPKCKKKLYGVEFSAENVDGEVFFYLEGEGVHLSKYNPELLYGYPPTISVWQKVTTLIEMDRYLMLAYQKQRPPRGLLIINTANADSAKKAWEYVLSETRRDPHAIAPWIIENKEGKNMAQWIDLLPTLNEMQYTETRNEMRRQIGALYGVMPLFQADLTQGGGLNQEGLQVTVTNRAVEKGQKLYNDRLFPKICEEFNITDYVLTLKPSEERDEMAPLQQFAQKVTNANAMRQMGFGVEFLEDAQDFKFSKEPIHKPLGATGGMGLQDLMTGQQRFSGEPQSVKLSDIDELIKIKKRYEEPYNPQKAIKNYFLKQLEALEKEDNINLIFKNDEVDELTQELADTLFERKFEGLSKRLSEKAKGIVIKSLVENKSVDDMIKEMVNAGIDEGKAQAIARTETQALQLKARKFFYNKQDPEGEFKYKWINPNDNRTTDVCRKIMKKTRSGVTLKKLRQIVHSEGKKAGFSPREFTPHINCRSTFVKVK